MFYTFIGKFYIVTILPHFCIKLMVTAKKLIFTISILMVDQKFFQNKIAIDKNFLKQINLSNLDRTFDVCNTFFTNIQWGLGGKKRE